jgi:hypothetical protein
MDLKTFADKAPANSINARDLDANFRRLRPLPQDGAPRHYYLNETPDGWSIRVLPNFPNGTGPHFLAIAGGQLYWSGSGVDEPSGEQLQLVEVERCDGKRMKVLGTGWYDP